MAKMVWQGWLNFILGLFYGYLVFKVHAHFSTCILVVIVGVIGIRAFAEVFGHD